MENRQNKGVRVFLVLVTVLLVANLVVTGIVLCNQYGAKDPDADVQTKYTLYIGTNDKDTYQQEIPLDECRSLITEICTRHTGGCTLMDAAGYWADDTGSITCEQTIVCVLEDISAEEVHAIADEVITALNQNSVLIETETIGSEFYYGSK